MALPAGIRARLSRCLRYCTVILASIGCIAHAGSVHTPIVFHATAHVEDARVRLGDVADIATLPAAWRDAAAALIVARLDPRNERATIPIKRLAEMARRQMPRLTGWLPNEDLLSVDVIQARNSGERVARDEAIAPAGTKCLRVAAPIGRGTAIRAVDVMPVTCPRDGNRVRRTHFDRDAKIVRAGTDLASGDLMTDITPVLLADVRRGDTVSITSVVGGVSVTRTGTALVDRTRGRSAILYSTGTRMAPTQPNP
ncbi:hypothetical protein BTH42_14895 [Burkholderia sp. SRS-W-2-2016]|uniref:hypothetical protein n=1 Tax=Burkholderia sp. SRS-W-2-2016 TaxID=1926878 RepID=UPI00094AED31|nr:hypothetical protein [Burkholderia sp. SRS-W-2-2016]OLL30861.1 hypothetical protein BTH42_14895 [Burkholderia sp. SRS-W-2-2016]